MVEEISGIARLGDELLLVGDGNPGTYYRFLFRSTDIKNIPNKKGKIIIVDPKRVVRHAIPQADFAFDLESIDILADGRVVLLSERLRSLIGENGLAREYDNQLSEFGNIGLEGLAIRKIDDGSSRVAALWEGGYPAYNDVSAQLQKCVGRLPLRPVIWIHDIEEKASGFRKIKKKHIVRDLELAVPTPKGQEPYAQRFRAPDLVWCKQGLNEEDWGFIVLLSSNDSPDTMRGKPKFKYQWLQRFSSKGMSNGQPLDLDDYVPEHLIGANWEGLSWFEPGKSVVVMHDKMPKTPSPVIIVELPLDWCGAMTEK